MAEQWEKIIESELEFLRNAPGYEAELNERLRENEMDFKYPTTTFDSEQGRVYRSCPGTEEQALHRIEVRENLQALMNRLLKRANRIFDALNQLDENDREIIIRTYIEMDKPDSYVVRDLGFITAKEFNEAKKRAIKKMFKIYESQRTEAHSEYRRILAIERKKKVAEFKLNKPYNPVMQAVN
ncbi:hypothetical protein DRW41_21980 [Neobacillus piezotolerans]|uniref:Uncharacterized protein n=1 Tax=Neobacillus piezotolerans TaxID=2259171 RepID=A0A3D8GK77_9BACI|nr:hypothetical protein [Neobacillus piezotolerans]RDU34697.1 hypothetical protein DRW41_21980 [Neobacillus piezotolerans]